MDTWFRYRLTWAAHAWVALILLIGVVLVVSAVVGMVVGGPEIVLFIPGLAAIFIHHLIVQKVTDRSA